MKFKKLTDEQKSEIYTAFKNKRLSHLLKIYPTIGRRTLYDWAHRIEIEYSMDKTVDEIDALNETVFGEETDFSIKAKSTLYDANGNVKLQWVKTDAKKTEYLDSLKVAINELIQDIPAKHKIPLTETPLEDELLTVYISNDIHYGALCWGKETLDRDWDLKIADRTIKSAYNYLTSTSPNSKQCIILDLGDLMEIDDFKNQTPKSGNVLTVDGRYPKVLRVAYMSLIYGIEKALEKHEIVHFINIAGNHDITSGHTIREVISAWYRDNPRVIVDQSPSNIKYFEFGDTLLQFAHGDGLNMKDSGEVMFVDKRDVVSKMKFCYSLFGHNHKDSVVDGRLTRAESFRNLAPLNDWASHAGYRSGIGTMTSITYSQTNGEISRNKFNVYMVD